MSAAAVREVAPRPGRYTLQLDSDDGSRLWLDGKRVIDRWQTYSGTHQVEVELSGQPQALRIDYFDIVGGALIHLNWAREGGVALQPVPTSCLFHDWAAANKAVVPPLP